MIEMKKRDRKGLRLSVLARSLAVGFAAASAALPGWGFTIETGNPDLSVKLDNQLRYNLGFRAEKIDPRIGGNPLYDEGDYKFAKRGDIISNRLDLLSELEVGYKRQYGFRVSAAAWADDAYRDTSVQRNPALSAVPSSYVNDEYSALTKRFYRGPSGEFLDAFVYANVDVAGRPLSVKVGQHTVYWGNALFSAGGVSYSQQPIDGRKGAANPGVEVRELFLPLNQVSATYQATEEVQLLGQYFFDWKHVRSPEGGTFLGGVDLVLDGPQRLGAGPLTRGEALGPQKKSGNWGVGTRVSPLSWNGTTVGVYYREFDEKNGLWLLTDPASPATYRAVFPTNTKLLGVSVDATVGPAAVGGEFVLRRNAGLNSTGFAPSLEGARGDVYHASINTVYGLTKNALWDFGVLAAELTYDRLDKVTKNPALFNSVDARNPSTGASTCPLGVTQGCATKDAWGLGVRIAPSWSQVWPSVDLTVPVVLLAGLKGNSPDFGGVSEGQVSWSVGVELDIRKQWLVSLNYADVRAKIAQSGTGPFGPTYTGNGSWNTSDRGRVSFTVKTSF